MYDRYLNYVRTIRDKNEPFKRSPEYTYMLEHVSYDYGVQYLTLLRSEFGMTDEAILGFCELNDSFGNPNKFFLKNLKKPVSPTSLRYLYHANCILKHANPFVRSFVELGGGYGGLYLALKYLAPNRIQDYHIVDLDEVLSLIKLVVGDDPRVHYHSASDYGKQVPDNCFFISNYCYSEISSEHRTLYKTHLLSRCSQGFLTWNHIPYEDIGKSVQRAPETPMTGPGNEFVLF